MRALKSWGKKALAGTITASGLPVIRDVLLDRRGQLPAAIILFHRVTDKDPEDGLTVSVARFESYLRVLKEQFRVFGLSEMLDMIRHNRPFPRRAVAITFDDGYLDNFQFAAPSLAKYGLPATFFVVADFMGSKTTAWWDHSRGQKSEWMNWSQVRELSQMGFEIGSHTMTHCDMGVTEPETAWRELCLSREVLEQQLGEKIDLFAYPYGGAHQMSEENRALVEKAGYRCCLSACGGLVPPSPDPYRLDRLGVDRWFEDGAALAVVLDRVDQFWRLPQCLRSLS